MLKGNKKQRLAAEWEGHTIGGGRQEKKSGKRVLYRKKSPTTGFGASAKTDSPQGWAQLNLNTPKFV